MKTYGYISANAKTMTVTLPDGETITTTEPIQYRIDEPGNYNFTVETEGKINNYTYSGNSVNHSIHQQICGFCNSINDYHDMVDEDYDDICDICEQPY